MGAVDESGGQVARFVVQTSIESGLAKLAQQALVDTLTQKGDRLDVTQGALSR